MKRVLLYRKKNMFAVEEFMNVIKNNSNLFMVLSVYICGNISGTVMMFLSHKNFITVQNIITLDIENMKFFIYIFLIFITIYILMLVFGLCCFGSAFILIISAFSGVFSGSIITYFIVTYGYKGILFYIFSFFPAMLLFSLIILVLSEISLSLSFQTAKIILTGTVSKIKLRKYLAMTIFAVPSSAIVSLFMVAGKWILLQFAK